MPASRVWSLASPLKRSEYLAAGLLVYGMDHSGHQIEGASDAWFKLSPQEDFHEDAIEWMSELSQLPQQVLQERSDVAVPCRGALLLGNHRRNTEELLQAVSLE